MRGVGGSLKRYVYIVLSIKYCLLPHELIFLLMASRKYFCIQLTKTSFIRENIVKRKGMCHFLTGIVYIK